MTIPDAAAARLRTYWPWLLGTAAAWLLAIGAPVTAWLHTTLGVTVTQTQIAAALALGLGWLIYEAGRWLEDRPGDDRLAAAARTAGRLLLSLGLHTGQPVYGLPPAKTESVAELYPDGSPRQIRSTTIWPPQP